MPQRPRRWPTALASIGLIVLLLGCSPPAHDDRAAVHKTAVAEAVDAIVRTRLAHPQGPASVSVAIVRGGETLVQRAWGIADAAAHRPATEALTYRIGSVSKQFTAALILKLVDRGALSLGDTLGRLLTTVPRDWQPITIEQLLNHTSGLQRDYRLNALFEQILTRQSSETQLAAAGRDPLLSPPGTRHFYSNTGYMVLGVVIEKLCGKPYRDAVRDEIARPLGLTTLEWCATTNKRATDTIGHIRSPQGALQPAAEIADLVLDTGGLCMSAGDLARWNQGLHGGRVLSPASYTAMITPRGAAVSEHYGFGIRVLKSASGAPILTHDGNTITFVAENTWYPAHALSVTVLYNSPLGVGTSPMAAQLARLAMGEPPSSLRDVGEAGLTKFVGFYEGRPGRGFTITLEDGTLYGQPTGNTKAELVLQSGTTYAVRDGRATLTFTLGADGSATALVLRAGTREQIFPKAR